MNPTILLATTNRGKVREIRQVVAGLEIRWQTLDAWPDVPEPAETGGTFAENAALKARYYADLTGWPAIGEDSGLAIDALDGRPGIHSARYPGQTYPEKFARLYAELSPHRRPWTARYVCSVALARPAPPDESVEPLLFAAEATVEGEIAPEPTGTRGFGYDPVFHYPPYGTTLAAVDDDRKLAVAHRGKAFRLFRAWYEALSIAERSTFLAR